MNSTQLARLIAVYSYNNKVKAINGPNGIAVAVGQAPVRLINALYAGERLGIFTLKRNKTGIEKVTVSDEQYAEIAPIAANFGEVVADIANEVKELVANYATIEHDISTDQLNIFVGVAPIIFETVLLCLPQMGVVSYDVGDPFDRESVYKFLTLAENVDQRWGLKQFKKR